MDTIKLTQQKLRQMLERLHTQNAYVVSCSNPFSIISFGINFSLNRASLHELELDSQDKFRARVLDTAAHSVRTTSRGINFYHGIEQIDNT